MGFFDHTVKKKGREPTAKEYANFNARADKIAAEYRKPNPDRKKIARLASD